MTINKEELKNTLIHFAKKCINPEDCIEYIFYHNLYPELTKEDKIEMLKEVK